MKKLFLLVSVSVMALQSAWAQAPAAMPAPATPAPMPAPAAAEAPPTAATPPAMAAAPLVPIDAPATAAAPTAPSAPAVTAPTVATPTVTPPVTPVPEVVTTAPPSTAVEKEIKKDLVPADIRASVENDFKTALPFALTHEKMKAYVRAAARVEKVNRRWDVQIASVETDQAAMENNNFAAEDIGNALKNMKGITMPEYSAMTLLTTKDTNFARLVNVYHGFLDRDEMGEEGVVDQPVVADTKTSPTTTLPDAQTKERMDAIQTQIQNLSDTLKTKPAAEATTSAASDPVLAAQLEAMNATLDKISAKVQELDKKTQKKN